MVRNTLVRLFARRTTIFSNNVESVVAALLIVEMNTLLHSDYSFSTSFFLQLNFKRQRHLLGALSTLLDFKTADEC